MKCPHLVPRHDETRAGFDGEPRFAETLVVQLLDELELNRNLPGVGDGQDPRRLLDEADGVEVKLRGVDGDLKIESWPYTRGNRSR